MDSSFIEILTGIDGSHRETKLHINWRGMTEDQIRTLAQRAVIAAVQQDYKANGSAPSKDVVEASWFLDRSTPSPIRKIKKIADLPEHLIGAADKEEKSVSVTNPDAILARLTDAEKADLIKQLSGG